MDELEISGKRYLSSKRAAKEHKYHADYIGQLIRAGKVVGTKVGRAWYVEATSLDEYLANEFNHAQHAPVSQSVKQHVVSIAPPGMQQTEKVFSVQVKKETPHIHIEHTSSVAKPQALRYIADESPVFPVLQQTSQIYDAREFAHATPKVMPQNFVQHSTQKKKIPKLALVTVVALAGGVTFALVLFASANLLSVVTVEQGKPAAAGFSFE